MCVARYVLGYKIAMLVPVQITTMPNSIEILRFSTTINVRRSNKKINVIKVSTFGQIYRHT